MSTLILLDIEILKCKATKGEKKKTGATTTLLRYMCNCDQKKKHGFENENSITSQQRRSCR